MNSLVEAAAEDGGVTVLQGDAVGVAVAAASGITLQDNDILCGQSARAHAHPGTIRYKELVKNARASYLRASLKDREEILTQVRSNMGRFLMPVGENGYAEMDPVFVRKKLCKGLSDKRYVPNDDEDGTPSSDRKRSLEASTSGNGGGKRRSVIRAPPLSFEEAFQKYKKVVAAVDQAYEKDIKDILVQRQVHLKRVLNDTVSAGGAGRGLFLSSSSSSGELGFDEAYEKYKTMKGEQEVAATMDEEVQDLLQQRLTYLKQVLKSTVSE